MAPASGMHRGSFGDLVDDLFVGAQTDADDLGVIGGIFGENRPVCSVMAGRKHFLDVERSGGPALQGAAMDFRHCFRIGGQNDDRLHRQRVVDIAGPVAIGFADDLRSAGDNPAGEESGDVQLLPSGQIFPKNDCDFCVEHGPVFFLDATMKDDIGRPAAEGLERLCGDEERVQMLRSPALPGMEFLEARFFGDVFEPHRHDTYAIGLTMGGVQRFSYRGEERRSLPGQILVLHPDEKHDGGAGTDSGLYYRMLYIEPSLLARSLMPRGVTMPFVGAPVFDDAQLQRSLQSAFERFDAGLGTLMADDLIVEVTEGLLRHAGEKPADRKSVV